ncbi:MAG: FG-GAP repeat protein [Rhodospirillaceae bacterium]|nr:FG-GAP repeat protein [Rhodospirillaceae bacterium]
MNVANRVGRLLWTLALPVVSAPVKAQPQTPPDSSAAPPWMQVAYLKASNAQAYDHFGCGGANTGHTGNSVAISRDGMTLAVGAPYESSAATGINGDQADNSLFGAGAVYVFTRAGDTWVQQAYIKASNAGFDDQFGSTVALSADGDTLAVTAPSSPVPPRASTANSAMTPCRRPGRCTCSPAAPAPGRSRPTSRRPTQGGRASAMRCPTAISSATRWR